MGAEMPCCFDSKDSKMLEKALTSSTSQLKHDMRLARHNKLVNANTTMNSMLAAPKLNASTDAVVMIESAKTLLHRSPKNKNQRELSNQPKSILKPSSYGTCSPPILSIKQLKQQVQGTEAQKANKMGRQLKLKLRKLQRETEASASGAKDVFLRVPSSKVSQPLSSETENSTPSTHQERPKQKNVLGQGNEEEQTPQNYLDQMEDLFNSDTDNSDDEAAPRAEQSFTEIAYTLSSQRREKPRRLNTERLGKNNAVVLAEEKCMDKTKFAGLHMGKKARHRRSNTDYLNLLNSLNTGVFTVRKASACGRGKLELEGSGSPREQFDCNLSDHLYERKKRRQGQTRNRIGAKLTGVAQLHQS